MFASLPCALDHGWPKDNHSSWNDKYTHNKWNNKNQRKRSVSKFVDLFEKNDQIDHLSSSLDEKKNQKFPGLHTFYLRWIWLNLNPLGKVLFFLLRLMALKWMSFLVQSDGQKDMSLQSRVKVNVIHVEHFPPQDLRRTIFCQNITNDCSVRVESSRFLS